MREAAVNARQLLARDRLGSIMPGPALANTLHVLETNGAGPVEVYDQDLSLLGQVDFAGDSEHFVVASQAQGLSRGSRGIIYDACIVSPVPEVPSPEDINLRRINY